MFVLLLLSCAEEPLPVDSGIEVVTYCTTPAEADTLQVEDGDGDSTSGFLLGRLQTDVLADRNAIQFVAFVDYLIENRDVGGAAILGRTDGEGNFSQRLGKGNWSLKLSGYQSTYYCVKDFDFSIQAGKTTRACVDMGCAPP